MQGGLPRELQRGVPGTRLSRCEIGLRGTDSLSGSALVGLE